MFQKAERKKVYLKLGLMGPSGSGKSYGALVLAQGLAQDGEIAAIDTENGSLSLYSDMAEFDVVDIAPPFSPEKYIKAIQAAESAGYRCLIIDSFSHAWKYLLNKKEDLDKRGGQGGGNKSQWANWGPVKAEADALKDAILQSRMHVICCMRAKTEYAQEGGKVHKLGMAAVQEPDVEYEFTTVFDIAMDHKAMTSKDRTRMFGGDAFKIDEKTGQRFLEWLAGGAGEIQAPVSISAEELAKRDADANKAAAKKFFRAISLTPADYTKFTAACTEKPWQDVALDAEADGVTTVEALMERVTPKEALPL